MVKFLKRITGSKQWQIFSIFVLLSVILLQSRLNLKLNSELIKKYNKVKTISNSFVASVLDNVKLEHRNSVLVREIKDNQIVINKQEEVIKFLVKKNHELTEQNEETNKQLEYQVSLIDTLSNGVIGLYYLQKSYKEKLSNAYKVTTFLLDSAIYLSGWVFLQPEPTFSVEDIKFYGKIYILGYWSENESWIQVSEVSRFLNLRIQYLYVDYVPKHSISIGFQAIYADVFYPVLFVNYRYKNSYSFDVGWGMSNLIMFGVSKTFFKWW